MARLLEILKSRKFQTRLLSGIALVVLAVLVIMRGGALLFFVMMAVSMEGLFELYRVVNMEKEPIGFIGYAGGAAYYALLWFRDRSRSPSGCSGSSTRWSCFPMCIRSASCMTESTWSG